MAIDKEAIKVKVLSALDQLRPFLNDDGGDMELVEIQDDATVVESPPKPLNELFVMERLSDAFVEEPKR